MPIHVGALPWAAKAVEERFKDIHPGDVFLLNDPYHGGNHLPDLTAFVPVFAGDKRLFWSINRAHQSDIGGSTHGAYNAAATEIWQEGLRVTPLRLYDRGEVRDDAGDAGDQRAPSARIPRRSRGDDRLGACRPAAAVAAVARVRRAGRRSGDRGGARRRGARPAR